MKIQNTWREIQKSEQVLKSKEDFYAALLEAEKMVCILVKEGSSLNFGY